MGNLRRAAAVLATVTVIGSAALRPADAAISTTTFCANVPQGVSGFTDINGVPASQKRDIECLAASGITTGVTPTTYNPNGTVVRDSMASFVARLVDKANELEKTTLAALPENPPDAFTDDETSVHESNINRLAAADIVNGRTATTYAPTGVVNRAQMATFLVAAIEYLRGQDLPPGPNAFADDAGNVHEANIDKLANIDVVDGVGGGSYNPNGAVTRTQMASFLVRTLAWLQSQGAIDVLAAPLQTIVLSPSGALTNETDSAAGGELTLTASNIEANDVDIALVPCENVTVSGGAVTFADATPNNGVADPGSDLVEADIVSVKGAVQGANTESVSGVTPTNGSVTFTVDSDRADCVNAVVWDDADDDNGIDLGSNDRPTERFGVSGVLLFVPPAATDGPMDEDVAITDDAGNRFVGCELGGLGAGDLPETGPNAASPTDCATFGYDANDVFYIRNDSDLTPDNDEQVSLAAFETALSPGDDVAGTYHAAASSQSTFLLVDEAPVGPTGVSVDTVDADTLTVQFDELAGAESYRVYRNQEGGTSCPPFTVSGGEAYTLAGTVNGGTADSDSGTTNTFTDNGLTVGTRYCYVVTAIDDGDEGVPSAAAAGSTASDTTPPVALDTELTTNAGSETLLGDGDIIQICFDEAIVDPSDGTLLAPDDEVLQLRDADGTVATLTNAAPLGGPAPNATFRYHTTPVAVAAPGTTTCADNRVLEVLVTAAPTVTTAGSVAGLAVPATIIAAAQIENAGGSVFQPAAGGQEVVVDVEAGAEPN